MRLLGALIITALMCLPAWAQVVRPSFEYNYKVVYTGRLFGYFRYPEVQQTYGQESEGCPATYPTEEDAPEAAAFLMAAHKQACDFGKTVCDPLLAVGDNFAPFLLARRVWGEPPNWKKKENPNLKAGLYPKEEYDEPKLKFDNVACFMRLAGFAATVPGAHDFYYGPERLRDLTGFLNGESVSCERNGKADPNCYRPVRMLGTNLSLKVQRTNAQQSSGAAEVRLLRLPAVVLPWIRHFRIVTGNKISSAYLVEDSSGAPEIPLSLPADQSDYLALESKIPLHSRARYHIEVVRESPPGKSASSQREDIGSFEVSEPLLECFQGCQEGSLDIDKPYVLTQSSNGTRIAIFGVVDRKMTEFIGKLNYTWMGTKSEGVPKTDSSYETVVNSSDPAEALNQALQFCSYDNECKSASKILLAQMNQGEIQTDLLPLLRLPDDKSNSFPPFDIVLAQADADGATGSRSTTVMSSPLNPLSRGRDPLKRPTVLVPDVSFGSPGSISPSEKSDDDPYQLTLRLQVATVAGGLVAADGGRSRMVTNEVFAAGVHRSDPFNRCRPPLDKLTNSDCADGHSTFAQRVKEHALAFQTPLQDGDPKKDNEKDYAQRWQRGLEEISLRVMRSVCKSDIAMLQHRDVFYDPLLVGKDLTTPQGIDAAVGAIFWKGDFIQCINLTGQTIANLLKTSAELAAAQGSGHYTELSKGWALTYSGIMSDIGGDGAPQWLVHGERLDPKSLYSVAITDYLASGDTGFPELQGAQPPPASSYLKARFWRLADEVSARLNDEKSVPLQGEDLVDPRYAPKPPSDHRGSFAAWLHSWRHLRHLPGGCKTKAERDSATNAYCFYFEEQQQPTSYLRLYKADFSYSLFQHNGSEASVGSQFPGVTAVDLSGIDSYSFITDWQIRYEHERGHWGWYGETESDWGLRQQRAKSSPFAYQPSQTANEADLEVGITRRIYPDYANPSGLRLILPFAVKTQLARPYTQITPAGATSSATVVSAPRNEYVAFKPGLRFEHSFTRAPSNSGQNTGSSSTLNSYIEAGFESGELFHSPSAYLFANPGTQSATCPATGLIAVSNLPSCIGLLGPSARLQTVYADRDIYQQGMYFNSRLDVPLPWSANGQYVLENRGDFFLNAASDTPVNTRFIDDLKQSLLLPVYGKLSLGPTVEFVFFENKISGRLYHSYSTSVSVNYAFDWHPGLQWRKVLAFGSYQDAPNPVPTK